MTRARQRRPAAREAAEADRPAPAAAPPQAASPEAVLALQRTAGNQAVASLLSRQETGQEQPAAPASPQARAKADVQVRRPSLLPLVQGRCEEPPSDLTAADLTLPGGGALPRLVDPLAFPITPEEALRLLPDTAAATPGLERALTEQPAAGSPGRRLYLVYANDGRGPFPNTGSGADQGPTAGMWLYVDLAPEGTGLSRLGLTLIDMVTPRGHLPPGAPFGSSSQYETDSGPYSGVVSADVAVRVLRDGSTSIDVTGSLGVDSPAIGEIVQDFIHVEISDSPTFPWPGGTRALAEGGVRLEHTIADLVRMRGFDNLVYTGRLELDAGVLTGTRRTEADAGARFVMTSQRVETSLGSISTEFSAGVFARGFARYNDGRQEPIAGVEGGASLSFMVDVGGVGVGMIGETTLSTDPARQTGLPAGEHPAAMPGFGAPAGAHGLGKMVIAIPF